MGSNEVITAVNSSPLLPSPQTSPGHSLSHDESSPPPLPPPPPPLVVRPCCACKSLRRRCDATCILAPYFPPTQPLKFLAVHRVFRASNISKFLQGLPESQRADAADSMVYEAISRIKDPVHGCSGTIRYLQKVVNQLQMELATAKAQLVNIKCQQENLPVAETMTCMEMKEAHQLPMLLQPSLEDFMFGSTTFQTCEDFSWDNSLLPLDVTDSGRV